MPFDATSELWFVDSEKPNQPTANGAAVRVGELIAQLPGDFVSPKSKVPAQAEPMSLADSSSGLLVGKFYAYAMWFEYVRQR